MKKRKEKSIFFISIVYLYIKLESKKVNFNSDSTPCKQFKSFAFFYSRPFFRRCSFHHYLVFPCQAPFLGHQAPFLDHHAPIPCQSRPFPLTPCTLPLPPRPFSPPPLTPTRPTRALPRPPRTLSLSTTIVTMTTFSPTYSIRPVRCTSVLSFPPILQNTYFLFFWLRVFFWFMFRLYSNLFFSPFSHLGLCTKRFYWVFIYCEKQFRKSFDFQLYILYYVLKRRRNILKVGEGVQAHLVRMTLKGFKKEV